MGLFALFFAVIGYGFLTYSLYKLFKRKETVDAAVSAVSALFFFTIAAQLDPTPPLTWTDIGINVTIRFGELIALVTAFTHLTGKRIDDLKDFFNKRIDDVNKRIDDLKREVNSKK